MLEKRFGEEIAELVQSVTETDKKLPWEVRKSEALDASRTSRTTPSS